MAKWKSERRCVRFLWKHLSYSHHEHKWKSKKNYLFGYEVIDRCNEGLIFANAGQRSSLNAGVCTQLFDEMARTFTDNFFNAQLPGG